MSAHRISFRIFSGGGVCGISSGDRHSYWEERSCYFEYLVRGCANVIISGIECFSDTCIGE